MGGGFTDIFIKRPVFASVISLLLLIIGIFAYVKMPLREFPAVDANVINISTTFTGADPNLMESFITTPIESALAGLDGLDYMSSTSSQNSSNVTLYYKLGYNLASAVSDVMGDLATVEKKLPTGAQTPIVTKRDPNAFPIINLAFYSKTMTPVAMTDYLVRNIIPTFQLLPGVAQAKVYGSDYVMKLALNPYLMSAHNVTATDVKNAITNNNLQAAAGQILNSSEAYSAIVATGLTTAAEFNNMVIKQSLSHTIRLRDIGFASLGTVLPSVLAFYEGQPASAIGLIAQTDGNPLVTSAALKQILPTIEKSLPSGMHAAIVRDKTTFIKASLDEVHWTIVEAVFFVILVIFLFLGSWRTLLIPIVAIPLSLFGVCGFMAAMGYSINTMTLLAMVLAIGMVVDDAIVVMENIHRHIEAGKTPFQAALLGAREIRFAIIVMTLTLAAVYAPISFIGGVSGALFKEFAFTLAGAVVVSGFIALTLSPMLCSKVMVSRTTENKFEQRIERFTDSLMKLYKSSLRRVLEVRWMVGVLILVIFGCIVLLFLTMPTALAPKEDMGGLLAIMSGPSQASISYTTKFANQIDPIFKAVPQRSNYMTIVGVPSGVNSAIGILHLKPWDERDKSAGQIVASLFPKTHRITGLNVFPVNPYRLPGSGGLMSIGFVLKTTNNYAYLYKYANQVLDMAKKNKAFKNLSLDLSLNQPQLYIDVNRNMAAALGVSMADVSTALNLAFSGNEFSQFDMQGRSYEVAPILEGKFRDTPAAIDALTVRSSSGKLVPLSSLVTIKTVVGPQTLDHFQGMRSATISGSAAPGYTLGDAIKVLQQDAAKVLPKDISVDYTGQSRQYIESGAAMQQAMLFALIFIFLVLSAQFESYKDALIVLFTVPLSTVGALFALKMGGGSLNIYTWIGLLTLIGLITKHGILIVDFANKRQDEGMPFMEAIIEGAAVRLRPILMTTAAMLLGVLPLIFASGAGSVSRHQIGLVIFGGMLLGTCFSLYVVPTVYTWIATRRHSEQNSQPLQEQ